MSSTFAVTTSADDYYVQTTNDVVDFTVTNSSELHIWSNKTFSSSPPAYDHVQRVGYALIDTSGISGAITKAKFHWYEKVYTQSRGYTQNRRIVIGPPSLVEVYNSGLAVSAGWAETGWFSENALAKINTSGDTDIRLYVGEVDDEKYREWEVYAYDYGTGDRACYLEVFVGGRRYRVRCR